MSRIRLLRRSPRSTPGGPPGSPGASWCIAPTTALYFDPHGNVFPCCAARLPIGRISGPNRQSLRDIWLGADLKRIRRAVAKHDLSRGCAECALSSASGGRDAALAKEFDRWADVEGQWPVDIDFALSNTCNYQCVMCNGDLSSAIRSQREHRPPLGSRYDDAFFEEIAEFLPHVRRVAFKGGEPFLATEARRVMELMVDLGVRCEVKVTTNGSIWSDRVEHLVRSLRMEPIISIDAMDRDLLAQVRVGADPDVVWRNIDHFTRVAAEVDHPVTFSYCLLPSTWQELRPLMLEAERRGRTFVAVAHVNQPLEQSLLSVGVDELDEILRAMEAQAATAPVSVPELITVWDHALEWVRFCRDRQTGQAQGTPVTLHPFA